MEKLKKLFYFFWDREFIRFLFVSGVNTLVGYSATLFFRYVCGLPDPYPVILNFAVCFPLAYTLQTKVAFRASWELKRMFGYATTAIPNLVLQWLLTILIPESLGLPGWLRYGIISVAPLPVMFFVIRFIVRPMKRRSQSAGQEK